jgi:hypothetical protein
MFSLKSEKLWKWKKIKNSYTILAKTFKRKDALLKSEYDINMDLMCAKFGSGFKLAQDMWSNSRLYKVICLKVPEKQENFLTGSKLQPFNEYRTRYGQLVNFRHHTGPTQICFIWI